MFQRIFFTFWVFYTLHPALAQKNVVSGEVQNAHGNPMPNVTIFITNETQLPLLTVITDSLGYFYAEINEKTPFKTLQLQPHYEPATAANHVNTLDLIYMSRHIRSTVPFEQRYQIRAADVNHNQTVTTADMMQLRDWLLGKQPDSLHRQSYEYFAPNSWLFLEPTTDNTREYDGDKSDIIRIKRSALPRHHLSWVGFTSGDVAPAAPAQRPAAALEWPLLAVEKNNPMVTIPVVYRGAQPAAGLQFGLSFDPNSWELIGPSLGDVAGINGANFGLDRQSSGKMTFCWLAFDGESLPAQPGETLFYLTFRARQPHTPQISPLQLDTTLLYDGLWGTDDTEYGIIYTSSSTPPSTAPPSIPVTVQQSPTRITLTFDSDRAGKVRVVLSDAWGNQLSLRDVPVTIGPREIVLTELQQQTPGIYSWWIKLPNGKMYNGSVVKSEE
jgi:hypothetical protein